MVAGTDAGAVEQAEVVAFLADGAGKDRSADRAVMVGPAPQQAQQAQQAQQVLVRAIVIEDQQDGLVGGLGALVEIESRAPQIVLGARNVVNFVVLVGAAKPVVEVLLDDSCRLRGSSAAGSAGSARQAAYISRPSRLMWTKK